MHGSKKVSVAICLMLNLSLTGLNLSKHTTLSSDWVNRVGFLRTYVFIYS